MHFIYFRRRHGNDSPRCPGAPAILSSAKTPIWERLSHDTWGHPPAASHPISRGGSFLGDNPPSFLLGECNPGRSQQCSDDRSP